MRKNTIAYNIQNGYLWCRLTQFCWNLDLFSIDCTNGKVICAPEFPFKDMNVDRNNPPTIASFSDSKDNTSDMIDVEPKKELIAARHEIYVKNRMEKYNEHKKLKFQCKICQKRFSTNDDLTNHIDSTKHNQSNKPLELDFRQRPYYVVSFPVCQCALCSA